MINKYRKVVLVMTAVLAGTAALSAAGPCAQTAVAQEITLNASDALLKEQRLNMWYSQAIDSINSGDFENALLCLDGCTVSTTREGNPELYADLFMKRGYCYIMLGKDEDALEALDEALATDPEMENSLLLKVSAHSNLGQYPEAIESLEKYIEISGDESMYETMATLYEAQGDVAKAAECYEKFAQANSENEAQAALETGIYLMQRGQYEAAIEQLNKSVEAEEPADNTYYHRALCYMSMGDYENATADFGKSVEAKESSADEALYTKATCEMTTLDYENAIADFDACIEKGVEEDNSRINRGICRLLGGDANSALTDFNECIEKGINADEARFYRSYVYLAGKEYESALADLTACIDNGYDLPASYLQRAQVYKQMGDNEAYQADLEAARNAQTAEAETEAVTEAEEGAMEEIQEALDDVAEAATEAETE